MTFIGAIKMADENKKPRYKDTRYLSLIIAIVAIVVAIILAIWQDSTPPPDFSISLKPMQGEVQQGGVIQTTITVKGLHGYDHTVSLSASGQPSGILISFAPPIGEAKPSYTSGVTIKVDPSVPAGKYPTKIKGTGADGIEHSCSYTLTVNPSVTQTSTPTPTPTITPTPTPKFPSIKINNPTNGSELSLNVDKVEGNSSNLPENPYIWIITINPNQKFYIETSVTPFGDGTWSTTIYEIGADDDDVGKKFYIGVYLADQNANNELRRIRDEWEKNDKYPGLYELPKGAEKIDEVYVIGKNP